MNKYVTGSLTLAAVVALSGNSNDAQATIATSAWFTQSNPTCGNIYGSGITERSINNPKTGSFVTLSDGSKVEFTISSMSVSWSTAPESELVSSVILRSNQQSGIYAYSVPTTSDTNLQPPSGKFNQISVCEGVAFEMVDEPPPPPPPPLEICTNDPNDPNLPDEFKDLVSANCATVADGTILTLYKGAVLDANGNVIEDPRFAQCLCNTGGTKSAEPCTDATSDQEDSCFGSGFELKYTPTIVEFYEDGTVTCSYGEILITIAGRKQCYKIF